MKTNKLNRYDAYKPSGVEWLGEIPGHWEITRLGTRFEERRTKVSDKDYEPLSVTKNGILPQLDNAAKTNDGDNRKLVKCGDFVINSRSDRKGASGISEIDGSVSLINIVLEPKRFHPSYCNYLLKSNSFVEEFYRMGHGIVADLWTTRYDEMKAILLGIPPISEQTTIAQFLDTKTALIDKAIELKEKQIALLKERRQAIIHQAVTKGLNPDVPMKDSGIEWIGEIPAHWEVKKAKFIFNKIEQGWSPLCDNYIAGVEEWGVLKVGCVNGFDFNPFENKVLPVNLKPKMEYQIQQGDILISRANTQELVGSAAFVERIEHKLLLCDKLYRIRIIREKINPEFYIFLLKSSYARRHIEIHASGASPSMQNIGQDCIKEMLLFLPSIAEQGLIVAYLKGLIKKISDYLCLKEQEIEKLKEYKASLINSAVTGKIKVD